MSRAPSAKPHPHGCIRMGKADLEDLFAQVQVGDAVEIHAQHDATVDQALGGTLPSLPVAPRAGRQPGTACQQCDDATSDSSSED